MRLVIQKDVEAVAEWSANYVIELINNFSAAHPQRCFVLGLPTGSTPKPLFKKLVEYYKEGKVSFKNVKFFNMDEYVGCAPENPESFQRFLWEYLFDHIDVDLKNVHLLNGGAENPDEECKRYEEKIIKVGGIDLLIGGVGPDGHIAYNEPGSSLTSRSRVIKASSGNKKALTIGVGTILDAKEVLILATGSSKAAALKHAVEKGVSHMWTVSALQLHNNALIVCDEDATLELKVKTYRYFKSLDDEDKLEK